MSTRILSITLLVLSVCSLFSGESQKRLPSKRIGPCCIDLSTNNISHYVIGSTYQKSPNKYPCVDAIIFTTQDRKVCVDPNLEWVKEQIANMTQVWSKTAAAV